MAGVAKGIANWSGIPSVVDASELDPAAAAGAHWVAACLIWGSSANWSGIPRWASLVRLIWLLLLLTGRHPGGIVALLLMLSPSSSRQGAGRRCPLF